MKPFNGFSSGFSESRKVLGLEFEVFLDVGFGSSTPKYRLKIRERLSQELSKRGCVEHASWLNLEKVPVADKYAISISHCKPAGGFLLAPLGGGLGFDIEVTSRLDDENVLRVSSGSELQSAPSASLLWVAKEAAYKSLYKRSQPRTIGEVLVVDWVRSGEVWHFSTSNDVIGVAWLEGDLSFSVAITKDSCAL